MSKKPVKLSLFDPLYSVSVVFQAGNDRKDILKAGEKAGATFEPQDKEESSQGYYFNTLNRKSQTHFLWLESKRDLGVLAHEIIHLVFAVFESKGIPIRSENDEAFAYYHEYWFNRLKKELNNGTIQKAKPA